MTQEIPVEALPHFQSSEPQKVAIITGVAGQDGSYLAELLLQKNYSVIGVRRRTSNPNNDNISSCLSNPNFELITGDITDMSCVSGMVQKYQPNEVYNLAAQSFVKASFDQPVHTFETDAIGVINWLEVIRQNSPKTKFYQASTSEMFGKSYSTRIKTTFPQDFLFNGAHAVYGSEKYQDESTSFIPQSPYGIAKLAAHHMVRLYRESYGIQASCGILFNHESPRRGFEFVTRKITNYIGQLANNVSMPKLGLGNLDAVRDWGHAKDYVEAMYLMLQQEKHDDYVVCTGKSHSVRDFCRIAFDYIGKDYNDYVFIDPLFFRPAEVDYLHGSSTKAWKEFGWEPKISFEDLVRDMVEEDIRRHL